MMDDCKVHSSFVLYCGDFFSPWAYLAHRHFWHILCRVGLWLCLSGKLIDTLCLVIIIRLSGYVQMVFFNVAVAEASKL